MTTRTLALTVLAIAALALAPAAGYSQGNSGADQYREGVPNGGGETPTENVAPGDSPDDGSSADGRAGSRGSSSGAAGKRLAELTSATAPTRPGGDEGKNGDSSAGGSPDGGPATEGTEGAVQSSLAAGPGGLGWGLPVVMALGLVAAIAFRLRNRSLNEG